MITVNKIIPQTVEFFEPYGTSLGYLNQYEFNDLRIQIRREKVDGYYFMFEDEIYFIDTKGRLPLWPKGFFEMFENQLSQLL